MITKTPFICSGCGETIYNTPSFSRTGGTNEVQCGDKVIKVTTAPFNLCASCDPALEDKLLEAIHNHK